jgi:cation transport ATPase
MTQQWLKIEGMTCGSCERLIEREAGKLGVKVHKIDGTRGLASVELPEHNKKISESSSPHSGSSPNSNQGEGPSPELTPLSNLIEALSSKGYPAKAISDTEAAQLSTREPKPFEEEAGEFVRHFFGNSPQFSIERELFWQSIFLTVGLIGLMLFLDMFWFKSSGFAISHLPYLFYMVIAVVGNIAILWHLRAYPRITSHMDGMMIGMTAGMATGLMIGAVVGATNGIFIGSLVGMLTGCAVGAYAGKCCGIMGLMEGLMAGIMGGTMGPMISVMMALDHLALFMPLFILACMSVLFGLTYMLILSPGRGPARKPDWDFSSFAALCLSIVLILSAIMVWGPHGAAII